MVVCSEKVFWRRRKPYYQITSVKPLARFTGYAENHVNTAMLEIMPDKFHCTLSEFI